VRERLYKDQQVEKEKNLRKANNSGNEWKSVEGLEKKLSDTNQSNETSKSMPIADEFLETTVMFADLAGFTKWSSNRKPQEVFHLLETFYGAFDAIAMKRKVFKVETIGDCYLAVTGLPEPQPDHAVIMAKFARDCMLKMKQLTRELEQSMGPDVLELEFRVGLNSGPVTAGVLRGDKSRFQLFGDTVNTAARMESNGIKGRIHCSQATADQMIKVGKSHWLKPREGGVQVKGKGRLDTYFLNPVVAMSQTVATSVHPGEGDVDML
jgi:class 3 adenylate cyclase